MWLQICGYDYGVEIQLLQRNLTAHHTDWKILQLSSGMCETEIFSWKESQSCPQGREGMINVVLIPEPDRTFVITISGKCFSKPWCRNIEQTEVELYRATNFRVEWTNLWLGLLSLPHRRIFWWTLRMLHPAGCEGGRKIRKEEIKSPHFKTFFLYCNMNQFYQIFCFLLHVF